MFSFLPAWANKPCNSTIVRRIIITTQSHENPNLFRPPPIPIRDFDWSAIDDDTYDYDAPIGQGPTEAAAIADLLQQIEEQAE
jgi:hypothetical protein